MKLQAFLDEYQNYDPCILLEKVRDSWLTEEEIILLIKEKRYEPAIEIFVKNDQFKEAEDFCIQRPQLGLLTTLLKIFFDKHAEHEKERNNLISQKKITESIEKKE